MNRSSCHLQLHELGVVKTLWRNDDDMTVKVVPVSGVTLAWKEDPAWLKIIGILGVGRDKGVRLFVVARSMQVDPLEDTDSIGSNVSAYEGGRMREGVVVVLDVGAALELHWI